MPTYEYVCRDCAEHLEVVQSFRDDPLATCGKCGGSLRKVFTAAGIIFKGSGFYSTDNRSGQTAGSREGQSSSASSGSGGDSGDSGSGDSSSSDSGSGSSDGSGSDSGTDSGKGGKDTGTSDSSAQSA